MMYPQSGEAKPQFTCRFRKDFPFVKSSCDGTVSENLAAKHKNMQRAEEAFAKTGVSIASSRRGEIEEMCDKWAVASSPALLRVRAAIGVDFIDKGHRFLKMDSSVRGFLVVLSSASPAAYVVKLLKF